MAFLDDYDFGILKNEAEELVLHELDVQLAAKGGNICRCEECVMDMASMALNAVKPLYRSSLLGSIYAAHAINEQAYADSVQKAVADAISKVASNPGHD